MKNIFYWATFMTQLGLAYDLQFNYTPDQIKNTCKSEQVTLLKAVEGIELVPLAEATFKNTVLALEYPSTRFSNNTAHVTFLKYVSTDAAVREAADACETSNSQFFVDLFAREALFLRFQAVTQTNNSQTQSASKDKKLLEEYLTSFKRNGLALTAEKRKLYVEKKKQLVLFESEFSNNLVKEKEFLPVDKADLDGVPETFIQGLKKTEDGKYKLTLDYPTYYTFMDNAKSGNARKQLSFLFNRRGGDRNRDLLEKAIVLRDEMAKLLDFKNHAAFILDRRMAKTPEQAYAFLNDLAAKLKPMGQENLKDLLTFKKKELGDQENTIYSYDYRYYENKIRKEKFQVDSEKIREYFPLEVVLKGLFEAYQTLLNVQFIEVPNANVWHPAVKKFKIVRDGETAAYFFMDLYPREAKYGHAAAFTLVSGYEKEDGKYESPAASIVANFNPPTNSNPSLLDHDEVETLFHEFGHIMHQTLTQAKYATFSGTNVKTDYVEAPSQMLENWVWNKETLKLLSGHYQDNTKKLPDELIEKMLSAKLLNVGLYFLRQISFGLLDMDYHTSTSANTTEIYAKRMKETMMIPIIEGTIPQASFGHLMGGYDAGYYGYLWSKVFAQDMFTRFQNEGLLNTQTGSDYRKWILEPGGEQEPMDLITGFLGRTPNNEAFLKSIGL